MDYDRRPQLDAFMVYGLEGQNGGGGGAVAGSVGSLETTSPGWAPMFSTCRQLRFFNRSHRRL